MNALFKGLSQSVAECPVPLVVGGEFLHPLHLNNKQSTGKKALLMSFYKSFKVLYASFGRGIGK